MKVRKQIVIKLLMMSILTSFLAACFASKPEKFAADAPVKKIVFDQPFPNDLIYQSSPDKQVIVGTKELKPAIYEMNGGVIETPVYEISGFDAATGEKLWQLPFIGEIVGNTEKQLLVYEEKTLIVHFVQPLTGEITRKVSPAPNPLSSHDSLKRGMAFSDEFYITTKALYTSIYSGYGDNRQDDETFKIGYTAKAWENNETKWFVPPIKQIVILGNRPVIFADKVLIINAEQGSYNAPSYQIISLKTGEQIARVETAGNFSYVGQGFLIEQTASFVRRIEPFSGREIWKIEGDFKNVSVAAIADQITIDAPPVERPRTIRIVGAATGKSLKQFDLPDLQNTSLNACFVHKDGTILLNFDSAIYDVYDKAHYNYWVAYDAEAKKALWRTDYESHSASSLFDWAGDKARFIEIK